MESMKASFLESLSHKPQKCWVLRVFTVKTGLMGQTLNGSNVDLPQSSMPFSGVPTVTISGCLGATLASGAPASFSEPWILPASSAHSD